MLRDTRKASYLGHGLVLILLILSVATIAWADEDVKKAERKRNRFFLGVGGGYARFDTNFKFTDKASGVSVFVDGEGTLGLPETRAFPLLYGYYRFSKRHGIGFSYFGVERKATLLRVNETTDFNLGGDLTIVAGADAEVTLTDESSFYSLVYNFTLFEDDRSFLFLSFGLYGLDLRYKLDASGELTLQGTPVLGGTYNAEASVFAPLPLVGFDAWFLFSPKWALGTRVSFIGGSYDTISGLVIDTTIRVKYQISRHVGFIFGINYFDAELDIDDPDLKTEINYGFDGVAIGVDLRF